MSKKILKILIVDDNDLFRKSLTTLIEKNRFSVVGETNHTETALTLIEEKEPDIIFSDLVMPEQDVLSFINQVRKKYPHIPIIVCSSLKETHVVSRVLEQGCFDYLLKPLNEKRLVQSLEKAGAA